MLAGEPPFAARSVHGIVAKRISDPTPSVRARSATVPAHVDQAIRKALAVEPAQRHATLAAFADALSEPRSGRGAEGLTFRRLALLTGGLLAALVLARGLVRQPLRPSALPSPPVIAVLPFDNLGDTAAGLRGILEESFQDVAIDVTGSAALFTASRPRGSGIGNRSI